MEVDAAGFSRFGCPVESAARFCELVSAGVIEEALERQDGVEERLDRKTLDQSRLYAIPLSLPYQLHESIEPARASSCNG